MTSATEAQLNAWKDFTSVAKDAYAVSMTFYLKLY